MDKLHFDPDFDGILYLEDEDFDQDGKLIPQPEDKGKSHIVMVFANWCGPCKATKPLYGKLSGENGVDKSKVRVACINCTSTTEGPYKNRPGELALTMNQERMNKVVPGLRGFPTIVLFDEKGEIVKNEKGDVKIYEGNRSIEDLVKFAHSTRK
jgi:thiol-disulfide isomerase/thioredoxin